MLLLFSTNVTFLASLERHSKPNDPIPENRSNITESLILKDNLFDGGYSEKILRNAPENSSGFFVVPKVIE